MSPILHGLVINLWYVLVCREKLIPALFIFLIKF